MSSNIIANANANNPAAQCTLKELMNLPFTFLKPKAAHLNIDPINA
jgi:hypothetical protein